MDGQVVSAVVVIANKFAQTLIQSRRSIHNNLPFIFHGLIFSTLAARLKLPPQLFATCLLRVHFLVLPACEHVLPFTPLPCAELQKQTGFNLTMISVRLNASFLPPLEGVSWTLTQAYKPKHGCICPGILSLFCSVQILFDTHPGPQNLQQNITKQTPSDESLNYLEHCFVLPHVPSCLVCCERALC